MPKAGFINTKAVSEMTQARHSEHRSIAALCEDWHARNNAAWGIYERASKAKLITFAGTPSIAVTAIRAGASHLVLDHPTYSARSFLPPCGDLTPLTQTIQAARDTDPTTTLTINCDRMMHGPDFPTLEPLLDLMRANRISHFRVQDIGLLYWLKQHCPDMHVNFAPEMGLTNLAALETVTSLANTIQLSNELSHTHIQSITRQFPRYPFLLQVQGKLLIQYSYRRYLAAIDNRLTDKPILAQDTEYPGRNYIFL
ncbi:MAG: U32 family peptidase, partial [Candidatus Margulisiibacteriota bacterium]